MKEYLPELTRRTRWHRCEENLKVGDVVVVVDGKLPRGCWPKGNGAEYASWQGRNRPRRRRKDREWHLPSTCGEDREAGR